MRSCPGRGGPAAGSVVTGCTRCAHSASGPIAPQVSGAGSSTVPRVPSAVASSPPNSGQTKAPGCGGRPGGTRLAESLTTSGRQCTSNTGRLGTAAPAPGHARNVPYRSQRSWPLEGLGTRADDRGCDDGSRLPTRERVVRTQQGPTRTQPALPLTPGPARRNDPRGVTADATDRRQALLPGTLIGVAVTGSGGIYLCSLSPAGGVPRRRLRSAM